MATAQTHLAQRDDDELLDAAMKAHYRGTTGIYDQPSRWRSGVEEVGGQRYVVLRNVNGILAVYRQTPSGKLQCQDEWPDALEEEE